jgi:hypothetical protein
MDTLDKLAHFYETSLGISDNNVNTIEAGGQASNKLLNNYQTQWNKEDKTWKAGPKGGPKTNATGSSTTTGNGVSVQVGFTGPAQQWLTAQLKNTATDQLQHGGNPTSPFK